MLFLFSKLLLIMKNVLILALMFLLCGCHTDKDVTEVDSTVCDDRFDIQALFLHYSDGTPVILTEYKIINTQTGENIELRKYTGIENGNYWITDDGFKDDFFEKEVELEFIGRIGNEIVVKERYLFSASECHVYLLKGNKEILINKD